MPNPLTIPHIRLYMRTKSLWRELAGIWILLIAIGGYLVGLYQATKHQRAICKVQMESVEKQREFLAETIIKTYAKGKAQ